jgi:anti-sigma factor RsiW
MKGPCQEFADKIVDYVDDELPENEAEVVARHLAECERCCQAATALQRSLGLAKAIWSDNLGDPEAVPARRSRRIRFYAVAASIVITASVLVSILSDRPGRQPSINPEDMERQVTRAGMAAELLAATRIVAQCEGTESVVQRQYSYILREYADTPAAETIRANYGLKLGDTQHE